MGCLKKSFFLLLAVVVTISIVVFKPYQSVLPFLPFGRGTATFHVYLMNNTPDRMKVRIACDSLAHEECKENSDIILIGLQRREVLTLDLRNKNSKTKQDKRVKVYFSTCGGKNDHYFIIRLQGKNELVSIKDVFISTAGKRHVLLGNLSDITPVVVGSHSFSSGSSNTTHTAYAAVQNDRFTYQDVDSLYLAIDKKAPLFKYSALDSEINLATYNFQAFPSYLGLFKNLNKPENRAEHLARSEYVQNVDVMVLEEIWDKNLGETLKSKLRKSFKYSYDPVPDHTHARFLNSGLLIFSKHPIIDSYFINYLDYHSLVRSDMFTNKGAAYVKFRKNNRNYHIIATHTQSGQDDEKVLSVRRKQFQLIKEKITNNSNNNISKVEPIFIMGDTNTNFFNRPEFDLMKNTLNLNTDYIEKVLSANPKYSNDATVNIMAYGDPEGRIMVDYIAPVRGYLQPINTQQEIIPLRALDNAAMYKRSGDSYGNIDLSDHFMLQAHFTFP